MSNFEGIRLPLDLLLVLDVDELEEALTSQYAVEYDQEIQFCKNHDDLIELIEDMDNPKYYEIDEIELDRIQAVIDLLNKSEDDQFLSHIINRIVR
jgi:hypothetical protein